MTNLADLLPAGGGQNNTDFVADGNVSSGAPVLLTAAGKAAPIVETSFSQAVSSKQVFDSGTTDTGIARSCAIGNDKIVLVYRDSDNSNYGTAVVGTLGSGPSVTYGTPQVVHTAGAAYYLDVAYDPDTDQVCVIDNSARCTMGTVSGTGITFGSAVMFASSSNEVQIVYDTNIDRFIIFWEEMSSGTPYGMASRVGEVAATSINFGTKNVFAGGTGLAGYIAAAYDSNLNCPVFIYNYNADSNKLWSVVGNPTGGGSNTITFGSQTKILDSTTSYAGLTFDSSVNKIIAITEVSGVGKALVCTPSSAGGTLSVDQTLDYNASNTIMIGIDYNTTSNSSTIVFRGPASNYYGQLVDLTFSGGTASVNTPLTYQSSNSQQNFVSANLTTGNNLINYLDAGGAAGTYAGSVAYQAVYSTTTLTSTNLLGIASGAISDTATGTINTWGSRNEVQTGLTIGSDYYVQNDGRIEAGVTNIAFDISSATYTQNFDISSQATIPQAIAFNPTGTKMFIVDIAGQDVNEYALSTGFDVSSASYTQNFSVASQDTAPTGISFNAAGTKMFVCGYTNDNVYEYTLSSGFNLSTASYAQALDVSGQDTLPKDVVFNTDGTKMFVLGGTGEDVNEYTLSAYDISTASFVDSFSVASQESAPDGIAFNTDGTKMFIVGNGDTVFQYNLSSGFDVSTASYASISFSVTSQETGPTGIAFSADGTKMFIVGTQGDDVNQYATTANSFSTDHLIGQAITATQINIKDYTG